MDKMKGLAKGGWHPAGDKQIHRDSWKSDLKGMATGKKKDPYEEQRNHESAPLSSLRDPESFGPPPKHKEFYNENGIARTETGFSRTSNAGGSSAVGAGPSGGWGSAAVENGYAQRRREQEEQERKRMEQQEKQESTMRGPYKTDTTGLRTDNLPKPPVRRGTPTAESPGARASPTLPPRQQSSRPPPAMPPRQAVAAGAPPGLPPRQNEYPDEYTPAPPPNYQEALQAMDPTIINQGAVTRLGQAGVSIPGFDIGASNTASAAPGNPARGPQAPQLSELQQRFARMNTGAGSEASSPITPTATATAGTGLAAVAAQKKPPPPPPKKAALSASGSTQQGSSPVPSASGLQQQTDVPAPPPVPMGSKPKPT